MANTSKARPMSRAENIILVELVCGNASITNKATNHSSNMQKKAAWEKLAFDFAAKTGTILSVDQLKLRWDNLKKCARKRSQARRFNFLKTAGEKSTFIPPDEVIDKVEEILGGTCSNYPTQFGGDSVREEIQLTSSDIKLDHFQIEPQHIQTPAETLPTEQKPRTEFTLNRRINIRKKKNLNESKIKKNEAISAYFLMKTEETKARVEKLRIENEILKIQLKQLEEEWNNNL